MNNKLIDIEAMADKLALQRTIEEVSLTHGSHSHAVQYLGMQRFDMVSESICLQNQTNYEYFLGRLSAATPAAPADFRQPYISSMRRVDRHQSKTKYFKCKINVVVNNAYTTIPLESTYFFEEQNAHTFNCPNAVFNVFKTMLIALNVNMDEFDFMMASTMIPDAKVLLKPTFIDNNRRQVYEGSNRKFYVDVEGIIHSMTGKGEPDYPVHNTLMLSDIMAPEGWDKV